MLNLQSNRYYIIITITTVGYGDISPKTQIGQTIIMTTILIVVVVLPAQLNHLLEVINIQKLEGGSYVKANDVKFVVVVGVFDTQQKAVDILETFLDLEEGEEIQFDVVFLSRTPANNSVKLLLAAPQYRHHVKYFVGSPMHIDDLERVQIGYCMYFEAFDKISDNNLVWPKLFTYSLIEMQKITKRKIIETPLVLGL
jgi:hypothetical protein